MKDSDQKVNENNITSSTDKMVIGKARKRPLPWSKYGEPPFKKPSIRLNAGFEWNLQALVNAADSVSVSGKSPVSVLNELGVNVSYSVLQQGGPPHCPSFTVSVKVADMTFEGWGNSKRDARAAAAKACLSSLLAKIGRALPTPQHNEDFTSDSIDKWPDFKSLDSDTNCREAVPADSKSVDEMEVSMASSTDSLTKLGPGAATEAIFGSAPVTQTHKSPINTMYENYPGVVFVCTFGDGTPLDNSQTAPSQLNHSMRFKVVCTVKEQSFEGYGSSKKLAKLAAARSALAALSGASSALDSGIAVAAGFLSQSLADHVAKLVNEKFNELIANDSVHSKRKVLAGIVMTVNNNMNHSKVIAVTTGTKCISGEHMSVSGMALNDCHAEVAARRCFQRYLYAQLLMYATANDPRKTIAESDLEPCEDGALYRLKPDRQVHLYVSTAPCGDGRIFSPHDRAEPDRHPNRMARGQLRTKIESGEGTIPVKNSANVIQTWDGVMQGERLLTMSCSDKVARWCVVGLQGALLAQLLKPVYVTSLVLGSMLHKDHIYRALCGRYEGFLSSLPPPYRLRRPALARAACAEPRLPTRAPNFSVCWCATSPYPEIVNATTGKLESGQPSLLCKQTMFARWRHLLRLMSDRRDAEATSRLEPPRPPADLDNILYNEAKELAATYQEAKRRLLEAFESAKLGKWVRKPMEQDQFTCEIKTTDQAVLFA